MKNLIGKEIYIDAKVIGLNGMLRATILEYDMNHDSFLVKGFYRDGRSIWISGVSVRRAKIIK